MPALVIAHPVKLATPEETVAVRPPVQLRIPLPGLSPVAMARVTVSVLSWVATLPLASSIDTETVKLPVPVAWMFWPELG